MFYILPIMETLRALSGFPVEGLNLEFHITIWCDGIVTDPNCRSVT